MRFSSCYLGNYKAWGRMIAARGVAVAMVDFRNSVHPSSAPEVAPFPAGLNDCVSGLKWVHAQADSLGIDPAHIVVAGEKWRRQPDSRCRDEAEAGRRSGLDPRPLCDVPLHRRGVAAGADPSSVENEGILLFFQDNRSTMAYGIDAFKARNPLACRTNGRGIGSSSTAKTASRRRKVLRGFIHGVLRRGGPQQWPAFAQDIIQPSAGEL